MAGWILELIEERGYSMERKLFFLVRPEIIIMALRER
jgi:hypothetical protein